MHTIIKCMFVCRYYRNNGRGYRNYYFLLIFIILYNFLTNFNSSTAVLYVSLPIIPSSTKLCCAWNSIVVCLFNNVSSLLSSGLGLVKSFIFFIILCLKSSHAFGLSINGFGQSFPVKSWCFHIFPTDIYICPYLWQ